MARLFALIQIIAVVFMLIYLSSTNLSSPVITGRALGTTYTIKIGQTIRPSKLEEIEKAIAKELDDVNRKMSTYILNSEISKFNLKKTTKPVLVSQKTFVVVAEAETVSKLSGGAFDITVGPLVNLWGFGPKKVAGSPSDQLIKETLKKVGYRNLIVHRSKRALQKKHPEIYIDLSAIAKGFAVDAVCDCLQKMSIRNYMVEIGGEIRVGGAKEDKKPWVIGIESPNIQNRNIQKAVILRNLAIATSGDYRNFRIDPKTKKRLSHTISPITGKPISHRLASVSVITKTCMRADAMATALMALGEEKGFALAEKLNLACYFIVHKDSSSFQILQTKAFQKLFGK